MEDDDDLPEAEVVDLGEADDEDVIDTPDGGAIVRLDDDEGMEPRSEDFLANLAEIEAVALALRLMMDKRLSDGVQAGKCEPYAAKERAWKTMTICPRPRWSIWARPTTRT